MAVVAEGMNDVELSDRGNRWLVTAPDPTVTRLAVDWAVTLTINANFDSGFEVRIGSPFSLITPEGQDIALDPEGNPFGLAPLLGIVRCVVREVAAFKDGRLEITLANGGAVRVPAAEDFEPWELAGKNGARIVAVPGGGLAVWQADSA